MSYVLCVMQEPVFRPEFWWVAFSRFNCCGAVTVDTLSLTDVDEIGPKTGMVALRFLSDLIYR